MRACSVFLCLLAASLALSIKSKPHGKHHGSHKTPHAAKEKDIITEEANMPQILPTTLALEVSSREQQDEELSAEDNANAKKEGEEFEETKRGDKSSAVLLSDEDLLELLKQEAEEGKAEEEGGLEEEVEMDKSDEVIEEEDAEAEKIGLDDGIKEVGDEEEVKEESADDAEMLEEEEDMEVERVPLEDSVEEGADREERVTSLEDDDGSTESEIPVDLDYAADSSIFQPIRIVSTEKHTQTGDDGQLPNTNEKEEEVGEKGRPSFEDEDEQNLQNTDAVDSKEDAAHSKDKYEDMSVEKTEPEENVDHEESRSSAEFESGPRAAGEEEGKNKKSGSHSKGKTRKQKKNQRARKHSLQRDEARPEQEQNQQVPQESEDSSTDSTVPKAKRRRAGKWGPLVGMNPVLIRATVDLYPGSRSSPNGGLHHPEGPADPCDNFPCKRGKTCKLNADNKPDCVCQEPSECPPSVSQFDHVCGTDNETYATSCELFANKCNLEGSKTGHRLHLDYTGPCKLIPACVETELVQFPLRMRDWLKNVLLQLYEHDSMSPGFLTPKQRFRVKKIFESERRLHAGDHSVELLAQDFEKNYNMYIYPVHWQFAQLDQHPSDRILSHSELAPLRVPLVPMEHCTSRFFRECDTDRDKQVSFEEWISCFGIKKEDMDVNQLF